MAKDVEKTKSDGKVSPVTDQFQLVVDYAKQETLEPIKVMANSIVYNVAGALCWGLGISLLILSLLRFLQTETGDVLDGTLSFVPYLITLLVGAAVALAVFIAKLTRR